MNTKLSEIEVDIINRINKLKALRETDPRKDYLLNTILSLTTIDSLLIFGRSNTTLENIEESLLILSNGLYDDGALSFVANKNQSVIQLVNDDIDTQFIREEEYFDLVELFNRASLYRKENIEEITDILDPSYGEPKHPSVIYNNFLSKAKDYMVSLGWEPREEQYNCAYS